MTNDKQTPAETPSCCSGGGGSCCSGPGRWIWLLLAAAIIGVIIARNLKQSEVPPPTQVSPAVQTNAALADQAATNDVKGQPLPRLVDLGSDTCMPCKMMAPILEDLKKSYAGKFDVQFVDVWQDPDAGGKYGIKLIPTQIFFDAAGKELFRHEGFFSGEDILAKWKELGIAENWNDGRME